MPTMPIIPELIRGITDGKLWIEQMDEYAPRPKDKIHDGVSHCY
jgi:hypothetical protein